MASKLLKNAILNLEKKGISNLYEHRQTSTHSHCLRKVQNWAVNVSSDISLCFWSRIECYISQTYFQAKRIVSKVILDLLFIFCSRSNRCVYDNSLKNTLNIFTYLSIWFEAYFLCCFFFDRKATEIVGISTNKLNRFSIQKISKILGWNV